MKNKLIKGLFVMAGLTFVNASHGRNLLLEILKEADRNRRTQVQQSQSEDAALPSGLMPVQAPVKEAPLPEWTTKEALIEATKRGELSGMSGFMLNYQEEGLEPMKRSVIYILANDYKTPVPPGADCNWKVKNEINFLMVRITELHMSTLSDKAPDFWAAGSDGSGIRETIKDLGMGFSSCTNTFMGVTKPFPYAKSLLDLANEYGEATKFYVEQERKRRVAAYEEEQRQVLVAQQKAQAEADKHEAMLKAAEQQRINAERSKVDAQERKRQQMQRSRVAG